MTEATILVTVDTVSVLYNFVNCEQICVAVTFQIYVPYSYLISNYKFSRVVQMVLKLSQSQMCLMGLLQCITFMISLNNVEWAACLLKIQEA